LCDLTPVGTRDLTPIGTRLRSLVGITSMPKEAAMFDDPTLVRPCSTLVTRLQDEGVLAGWSADVPELAAIGDVDRQLDAWADPARTHDIAAGLIRLAAADWRRHPPWLTHHASGRVPAATPTSRTPRPLSTDARGPARASAGGGTVDLTGRPHATHRP